MIGKRALAVIFMLAATPALGQLSLPPLGEPLQRLGGTLSDTLSAAEPLTRSLGELARLRLDRLELFVRRNRDTVEFDDDRQPARRGEAIMLDPDAASLEAARAHGYAILEQGEIEALEVSYARFALPKGESLAEGVKRLRGLLPGKTITADQIHFASGTSAAGGGAGKPAAVLHPRGGTIGVIDGGMTARPVLVGQRGFASGAPKPGNHADAIASLLAGAGIDRIWSADVYGTDPAGGNALAIARALGWMTAQGVPVVSISLVGPANPLLSRAVSAARAKGTILVAAVGNDGAAAAPAYPASYAGVVSVTGVDGRGRVLIEAGRALHLDYAAPGANLTALGSNGRRVTLRGTSFAAPLAGARIAAHRLSMRDDRTLLAAVDAEARDLGPRGPDRHYGRGLLCGSCRRGE